MELQEEDMEVKEEFLIEVKDYFKLDQSKINGGRLLSAPS